jgi:hypothetical protein
MTTYTIVQYDIARDVMYFLGTPTPDLKTLIENNSLSDTETKQIIMIQQRWALEIYMG